MEGSDLTWHRCIWCRGTLNLFMPPCWVRSINHQSKLKCGSNLLVIPFSFFQWRLFTTGHFSQLPRGRIKWQVMVAKFLIHSHKKCNHLSLSHIFFFAFMSSCKKWVSLEINLFQRLPQHHSGKHHWLLWQSNILGYVALSLSKLHNDHTLKNKFLRRKKLCINFTSLWG